MDTNKNIQNEIDSTLKALDSIKTVSVSPFFKDQTMQRLFSEKKKVGLDWNWFTPKLQLATLTCIVVLNIVAVAQIKSSSYEENIDKFAENYGFSTTTETSILN